MIDPAHGQLSIAKQCELIELPRSSYYRVPSTKTDENLALMDLIDQAYMRHPFYGRRKMVDYPARQGYCVNRKRVQRLMCQMEIS